MRSFKFKLVAYFALLSLLPLTAAFIGFSTVAARAETRTVDARLQAELRAALAAYEQELRMEGAAAAALARNPVFERALAARDRAKLERLLRSHPDLTFVGQNGLRIGERVPLAATRQVEVVGPAGARGAVIASIPLDRSLVAFLQRRSGLGQGDHLLLLEQGLIVGGPPALHGAVSIVPGRTRTITISRSRYRTLVGATLQEQPVAQLGVISPQSAIDAANWNAERKLLLGLLASLALVSLVAYIEGRAIVRTIGRLVAAARAIARGDLRERVPVPGRDELALLARTFNEMASQLQTRLEELAAERGRLQDAIARFGDVLAATHDVDQLRRVIVESAVESTGAVGGVLIGDGGELVQFGYPDKGKERIEVPLQASHVSYGSLLLFGDEFTDDQRMTAVSLSAQAAVALDNARLHRIVERQARVDGLTGLANRRAYEDQFAIELARVERFGGPLAVVIADLDNFKAVNDRHGHSVGDAVLREFALTLDEAIRDVDLAARWGGEEFALILPGTDVDGAVQVAERIRRALEQRLILSGDGEPIPVTASFGVAAFPDTQPAQALQEAADGALYQAKRAGKNRVVGAGEPVSHP